MINLAGRADCDRFINSELIRAMIPIIVVERVHSEVPYSFKGSLGAYSFSRAWYYWVVEGKVPMDVAWKIYNDPLGRADVRAYGHCMCVAPDWGHDKDGVDLYHIDSLAGLRLFADTIAPDRTQEYEISTLAAAEVSQ